MMPLLTAVELLARSGRIFEARLLGSSMGATIPDGSMIRIEPGSVVRGDVAVFRERDRLVAHRVVFRARDHLVVIGDGYPVPDLPVPASAVLGRVIGHRSDGPWSAVPARRKWGWISAGGVVLVSAALVVWPRLAIYVAGLMIRARSRQGHVETAEPRSKGEDQP